MGLVALVLLAGCAPPMSTALELPAGPRRPDGVAIDPSAALPRASSRGPAYGIVALKEPIGDDAVRRATRAFFDVFAKHDADALDAILSRSARLLDAHGGSTYGSLREELRGRIRAFEAAGVNSVAVDALERLEYRDFGDDDSAPLAEGTVGAEGTPVRPHEMRPGDVLVRVHVSVPRANSNKLFGPVVVLLFRWEEDESAPGKNVVRLAGYDEP